MIDLCSLANPAKPLEVLCLGYKANVVKDFFLTIRPQTFADCVVSDGGRNVRLLEEVDRDWSVTLLDTGIWRNIGERLWSARSHVMNEEMFLANYSDGLSDVDLDDMTRRFEASGKIACFLAVRPPLTYHLADIAEGGDVRAFRTSNTSDIWINGGYFLFRREIFDYMREGEELVLEPFTATVLALAIVLSAFSEEIFWAGINAVSKGQWEAGRSTGLSFSKTLTYIVLPQVVRISIPPLTNRAIGISKGTTLGSVVAVPELLNVTSSIQSNVANPTALTVGALLFLLLFLPFVRFTRWLEHAYAHPRS